MKKSKAVTLLGSLLSIEERFCQNLIRIQFADLEILFASDLNYLLRKVWDLLCISCPNLPLSFVLNLVPIMLKIAF